MKNTLSAGLALLMLTATLPAMAQTKVGFGLDRGLGVTAQLEDRFNLFIGNDGIAGDYLFSRGQWNDFKEIEGAPLIWYVGGGLYVDWDNGFGVRLPLGVELDFAPNWQAYAQIAPDLDLDDGPNLASRVPLRFDMRSEGKTLNPSPPQR